MSEHWERQMWPP